MCGAHAAVRHLLGGMLHDDRAMTIVDMEAGLEHLSRGTGRHVDTLLVTLEPYFKSLETARRSAELGRELGIARIVAISNKIRDEEDGGAVRRYASDHGLTLAAEIPFDDDLRRADLQDRAPIECPDSPAVQAIGRLAGYLVS